MCGLTIRRRRDRVSSSLLLAGPDVFNTGGRAASGLPSTKTSSSNGSTTLICPFAGCADMPTMEGWRSISGSYESTGFTLLRNQIRGGIPALIIHPP